MFVIFLFLYMLLHTAVLADDRAYDDPYVPVVSRVNNLRASTDFLNEPALPPLETEMEAQGRSMVREQSVRTVHVPGVAMRVRSPEVQQAIEKLFSDLNLAHKIKLRFRNSDFCDRLLLFFQQHCFEYPEKPSWSDEQQLFLLEKSKTISSLFKTNLSNTTFSAKFRVLSKILARSTITQEQQRLFGEVLSSVNQCAKFFSGMDWIERKIEGRS